ncbi:mCG147397 [Mus musculus]|jgi:hypothetical protein|nr:mCG147397 [Mus musculus]
MLVSSITIYRKKTAWWKGDGRGGETEREEKKQRIEKPEPAAICRRLGPRVRRKSVLG